MFVWWPAAVLVCGGEWRCCPRVLGAWQPSSARRRKLNLAGPGTEVSVRGLGCIALVPVWRVVKCVRDVEGNTPKLASNPSVVFPLAYDLSTFKKGESGHSSN